MGLWVLLWVLVRVLVRVLERGEMVGWGRREREWKEGCLVIKNSIHTGMLAFKVHSLIRRSLDRMGKGK